MAPPARQAIVALQALRSTVFQTTHNPENHRLGTKYLRRALRGPAVVAYYPQRINVARLNRDPAFADFLTPKREADGSLIGVVEDGFEECDRVVGAGWLDDAKERVRATEVAERRKNGRGPPKKGTFKRSGNSADNDRRGQAFADEEEVDGYILYMHCIIAHTQSADRAAHLD